MISEFTKNRPFAPLLAALTAVAVVCLAVSPGGAAEERLLFKLLKSGRLPAERQANVVRAICGDGSAEELTYIFQQCVRPGGYTGELRRVSLAALAEAAEARKVVPTGDLAALRALVLPMAPASSGAVADQFAAVRLAGAWKVAALAGDLAAVASSAAVEDSVRQAAIDALVATDTKAARATIDKLLAPGGPPSSQAAAIGGLVRIDVDAAAERAAAQLAGRGRPDPAPLVAAFLAAKGASDKLAAALGRRPPPADTAKLALRHLYAAGRSDASLVAVLSKAAGIDAEPTPPTKEELAKLAADVLAQGDPARGEDIFRRADLNCLKCHAINGAGGDVGPDLIGLGGSSPPDYLLEAVLLPAKAVKEQYRMATVVTVDGKVLSGVVSEDTDERTVLKDAEGRRHVIPASRIDEKTEGGSLMPRGLARFLTRDELVDLARFLYELGRPGGNYQRTTDPVVRRWRLLTGAGKLQTGAADAATIQREVLQAAPGRWATVYSKTSGALPLDELARQSGGKVLHVQADVDLTAGGKVTIELDPAAGTRVWINEGEVAAGNKITAELPAGRHVLTLRIDTARRPHPTLTVRLAASPGSTAALTPVAGS